MGTWKSVPESMTRRETRMTALFVCPSAMMTERCAYDDSYIPRMIRSKLFGDRLFYVRHSRGIALEEVARATGISRYRLEQYEMNVNEPGFDALVALALYLDTSADYLCGHRPSPARLGVKAWADEFGPRLRAARKKACLTQPKLAEIIGSDRVRIGLWENGLARPSVPTLRVLSVSLGVPIDYLCGF
jgi:transcriptional regulator with XRE-family HTH domain